MSSINNVHEATLPEVIKFISLSASEDDINRIYEIARARTKTLRNVRAASVKAGQVVKIKSITPKALVGLTGWITEHDGKHAAIQLDAESTTKLRYSRTRYATAIPSGVTEYLLRGVPLTCCDPQ